MAGFQKSVALSYFQSQDEKKSIPAWFQCILGGVKPKNCVDYLVIREEGRSTIRGHTKRRSRIKRPNDWKNGIRFTRRHGKQVICRGSKLNGGWRAGKEVIPGNSCHGNQENVKHKSDPEPVFIGPILNLQSIWVTRTRYCKVHRLFFLLISLQKSALIIVTGPECVHEGTAELWRGREGG